MSSISKEQVKQAAHNARIAISDEEAEKYAAELEQIIQFTEQLNELDTENIEPTTHVIDRTNVMREDVAKKGLPREEVLKNAPEHENGQFKVPSIIE